MYSEDNKAYKDTNMRELTDLEVDQVSGALAPMVVWGLWVAGGFAVGVGGAFFASRLR